MLISWAYQNNNEEHCLTGYAINISVNGTFYESMDTPSNVYNISSLIIGTNYSFIIIPIDTIGREGPPSSLIQYIWNGKYYTHTHTHCISYSTSSSC